MTDTKEIVGKKKKRGQPTKYNETMCDKADEYIKQSQDEEYEFHKTRGEKSDSYEKCIRVQLPTHEGFASFIGVSTDTLYEWAKVHKEFSVSLAKVTEEQKTRLLDKGLSGTYNPTIAKLILSSNHGMAEKTEQDLTSKGEKITGLAIEFVHAAKNKDAGSVQGNL